MHRDVCNDNKCPGNHSQTDHIAPEGLRVEPKGAQDRRPGDFDVQPILVVNQGEEGHLVHDQSLEAVVEDGELEHSQKVEIL